MNVACGDKGREMAKRPADLMGKKDTKMEKQIVSTYYRSSSKGS